MAYTNLDYRHVTDARLEKVFRHTDMILSDLYSMFLFDASRESNGGRGNFSIALVLLCIVDGLGREVAPTIWSEDDHERRFKKAIMRLPWQPDKSWVAQDQASMTLYLEVRNPLTHELGGDKPTRGRPKGWDEPAIHKWHPEFRLTADELDGTAVWPPNWPVLFRGKNSAGMPRYELSSAALYWAVKTMARRQLADDKLLNDSIELHKAASTEAI